MRHRLPSIAAAGARANAMNDRSKQQESRSGKRLRVTIRGRQGAVSIMKDVPTLKRKRSDTDLSTVCIGYADFPA